MKPSILIESDRGRFVDFDVSDPRKNTTSCETVRLLPEHLGQGVFTGLQFNPEMDICLTNCRFKHDYRAKVAWPAPMVTFAFALSGRTCTRNTCRREPISMAAGDSYVHYFQDPHLQRKTQGAKVFKGLVIRMSPHMLARIVAPEPEGGTRLSDILHDAIQRRHFFSFGPMTSPMKVVLWQMFECPHRGVVRKIYLESKAMELVAYKLEQITGDRAEDAPGARLKPDERDRLQLARDILIGRLKFPPSLADLAGTVGMSHTRLNRGFRKFFGCTVFEYLRRERLEYARLLLAEGLMNVTEVAFETGFCSSSHFSAAFIKYYGISPFKFRNSLVNGKGGKS